MDRHLAAAAPAIESDMAVVSGPITMVQSGDGAHIVKISQPWFGSTGVCEEGLSNQAMIMFATYHDPDTLEMTCGVFERDVGGCFEKTLLIGCDPETDTATIHVYVRDETFASTQRTDNPKIGTCKVGTGKEISRTIKISETFSCNGPPTYYGSGPETCSHTLQDCPPGTYCTFQTMSGGYQCKPYVSEGGYCGGFAIGGEIDRCDPSQAFCFQGDNCIVADTGGVCVLFEGDCTSDANCGSGAYCDETLSKCKPKLSEGDCCEPGVCADGLSCQDALPEGFLPGTERPLCVRL